jgi:hypothetical protein
MSNITPKDATQVGWTITYLGTIRESRYNKITFKVVKVRSLLFAATQFPLSVESVLMGMFLPG